jgi:hypothetical protein
MVARLFLFAHSAGPLQFDFLGEMGEIELDGQEMESRTSGERSSLRLISFYSTLQPANGRGEIGIFASLKPHCLSPSGLFS